MADWLRGAPSLTELRDAFPAEWAQVEAHLATVVDRGDPEALQRYLTEVTRPPVPRPGHARPQQVVVAEAVRRQMTIEAVRQAALRLSTGVTGGTLRLGLVNGWVLQRLLFERGLRRKAVNLPAFRLAWPLLPQRHRLMPLVMEQGIYCFHSRPLLRGLARIIAGRPCLEIAAGDGTLSRLLAARGVSITATDDGSWDAYVDHDEAVVERLDAVAALRAHRPEVVVCSWPPPGNSFERHVFETPSVHTYLVLTSRHESAAGNWTAYRRQASFSLEEDTRLSRYLLPPTVDGMVLVFRRRAAGSGTAAGPLPR